MKTTPDDILRSITDGLHVVDAQGRFIEFNEAARSLFAAQGLNADSLIGRHIFNDALPEARETEAGRALQRCLTDRVSTTADCFYQPWQRHFNVRHFPISNGGVATFFRDTTGQIQAEETRRENERRALAEAQARQLRLFEGLASTTPDFIYVFDPSGRFLYANRRLLEVWGRKLEDVVGRTCLELGYEPWHHEMHMREIAQVIATRQPIKGEVPFKASITGIFGVYEYIFSPVLGPDGTVEFIAGTTRDVTERKHAEEEAIKARARFDIVREGVQVGFWFCDLPFDKLIWDSRVKEHFWLAPDAEVTIDIFYQQLHPDDRERTRQTIGESIENKTQYEIEYRTVAPDGRQKWIRALGRTFYDEHDHPIRFDGITLDITEQRHATEALAREKEKAEAASRAKDQFLAALSHELRTPLTPVLLIAAALREDARLPVDVRDRLLTLERNVTLEARLIDDLLDVTAIAHGKVRLRVEPCGAHSLILSALDIVREEARAKGVVIETRLDARPDRILADPARFQQIVWNLLRNTVKFTPAGGKISIVTGTAKSAAQRCLRLQVTDTGIGIKPEFIDQIFLPFNQGHPHNSARFGGLGLGLTIARAIVDLHGGKIWVESEGQNEGATFAVEIPLDSGTATTADGATAPPHASPENAILKAVEPLHLLVVEDHESTLSTLRWLLERQGHHVQTARNVTDARLAAARQSFDLLISDLGLPDGTGTQLMDELRGKYGLKGIALTGYGMEDDIARCHEAGFVAHLAKPVKFDDLRRVIAGLNFSNQ
jgi:PAS domain S-box-containing protein